MARTAVVAGTATAVSNRVSRRQGERWQRQEEPQAQQQYAEAPPPQEADPVERLKELAKLRDEGILTEEEFAAQKAKILAT
jgi:hypothetical protein